MPCTCKNLNGEPSEFCIGCTAARMVPSDMQFRAQEDGFTNRQLDQIRCMMQQTLAENESLKEIWINGFIKGFEHGQGN